MNKIFSLYLPGFATTVAYMLQSTEYDIRAYTHWLQKVDDFRSVMYRRTIDRTKVAKAFVLFLRTGIITQLIAGIAVLVFAWTNQDAVATILGISLCVMAPITWAYIVIVPVFFAKRLYISPKQQRQSAETRRLFKKHAATKIAVAGSFGKTTMKELLATVLSEGLKVKSTPGNKNVATAHYQFVSSLAGDEDVLIVEFGEGKPGDVKGFTDVVQPDLVVITGVAPAHLDQYGTVERAASDIFTAAQSVEAGSAYINVDSDIAVKSMQSSFVAFSNDGLDGWLVTDVKVGMDGTRFKLSKGNTKLHIHSGLIGEHLVGVLATTAVIAKKLKLSDEQIKHGFRKTVPYEHRMQPYRIGGAWVIDDSYNGNLSGIKAGVMLLRSLDAKRKIYVTPGLVDQGEKSNQIHETIGKLIAEAEPDIVVLMSNSTTEHIRSGLIAANFEGEIKVQSDPLVFYTSLDQFVASGDIIMLQNDWTDNYH